MKNNKETYHQEYYRKNSERLKLKQKLYRKKNKEHCSSYTNNYNKIRRAKDPNFKLRMNLRNRLNRALKNKWKTGSAVKDLGCSIDDFKIYLESKFEPGMTWENWGVKGWHIDHIISLENFDLTKREEFLKACHYTNLQPLWCKDNWSKK